MDRRDVNACPGDGAQPDLPDPADRRSAVVGDGADGFNGAMLIERESHLADLDAAVDAAVTGHGRLVLVSGEAGVGKTTLVTAAAGQAADRVRVLRGVFDNVTTPAPFGALLDASAELADLVDAAGSDRPALFRRVRAALTRTPTLLILEDVHWADGATLDLLRFLGRRLADAPLMLVVTYRSDEVVGRHPLTAVLGDLATEPTLSRLQVEPLSVDAVARWWTPPAAGWTRPTCTAAPAATPST